jgi:hypothetical protein
VHANILTVHVHHLESRVLDELVISTPAEVTAGELTAAATGANGSRVGVWPSSSLALIDGQTKALALAARATADPSELPLAVAELLGARYLPDPAPTESAADEASDPTVLHISAESGQVLRFVRADEPFTPAEIARANRINDLAQIAGRR